MSQGDVSQGDVSQGEGDVLRADHEAKGLEARGIEPARHQAREAEDLERAFWPARPSSAGGRLAEAVEAVRARLAEPRVAIALLIAAALVCGVVWYRLGSAPADAVAPVSRVPSSSEGGGATKAASTRLPTPTTRGSRSATSTSTAGDAGASGPLVVHVAGAVGRPGIVRVRAGSRVADAVDAAGGAVPEADLDRLNLAAKVSDGDRVAVARRGEPTPPLDGGSRTGGEGTSSSGNGPADGVESGGPVNLNTATQAELEALPGIGPSLASAIVAERTRRGGFRTVNELREVRGIGAKRFETLRDLVAV